MPTTTNGSATAMVNPSGRRARRPARCCLRRCAADWGVGWVELGEAGRHAVPERRSSAPSMASPARVGHVWRCSVTGALPCAQCTGGSPGCPGRATGVAALRRVTAVTPAVGLVPGEGVSGGKRAGAVLELRVGGWAQWAPGRRVSLL